MSLFWANTWNYFIRSHVTLPINLILNRKFKAYTVFWGLLNNWHFCMLGHPLYLKWVMVSFITYQRREKMCEVTWIYGGSVINGADTSKTQSWELYYSLASQGRKKLKGTLYFCQGWAMVVFPTIDLSYAFIRILKWYALVKDQRLSHFALVSYV